MRNTARRLLTYADLLEATKPDQDVPELIDGELVYKASPRWKHSLAQGEVRGVLEPIAGGPRGGWWILIEPDIRFGPHRTLRPDLAGWHRERVANVPRGPVEVTPDWVCELLSPGHEYMDRGRKSDLYAQEGVPDYWLVHPEARLLEVWRLHEGAWLRHGTFTDGHNPILPPFDIPIEVARLFVPRDRPPLAHERPAPGYGASASAGS